MSDRTSNSKHSFDEFKLYYDSTEKVTDRRLDTNRWNYSGCIAILVAIAVLTKWSLTTASLIGVGFVAVAVLSTMAILFCFLWIRQIRDFKKLNTAKFEILNEMAPRLDFHPERPGEMTSFRPFEKEWEKLDQLGALSKVGRSKIVALKSSNIEFFIPKAFAALFASIVLTLILVTVFNWPPRKLVQAIGSATGGAPAQVRQP